MLDIMCNYNLVGERVDNTCCTEASVVSPLTRTRTRTHIFATGVGCGDTFKGFCSALITQSRNLRHRMEAEKTQLDNRTIQVVQHLFPPLVALHIQTHQHAIMQSRKPKFHSSVKRPPHWTATAVAVAIQGVPFINFRRWKWKSNSSGRTRRN